MGEAANIRLPKGLRMFISPGTSTRAGVAIIIRQSFLDEFDPVQDKDWIHVAMGRAAVLRLKGEKGSIDIWAIYGATGVDETLGNNAEATERLDDDSEPSNKSKRG